MSVQERKTKQKQQPIFCISEREEKKMSVQERGKKYICQCKRETKSVSVQEIAWKKREKNVSARERGEKNVSARVRKKYVSVQERKEKKTNLSGWDKMEECLEVNGKQLFKQFV